MTTRRRLFRTSSENNRSENPGYSYFSSIAEDTSDNQQKPDDNPNADSSNHMKDEKGGDSLIYTRTHLTSIDIKK